MWNAPNGMAVNQMAAPLEYRDTSEHDVCLLLFWAND